MKNQIKFYLIIYSMTQKQNNNITVAQTQYAKDADMMASKSRFGFFSLLPSHTAAITDYAQKKAQKDQNGKVKIQLRGIYSGSKSTKVLSKTCFSQIVSPYVGCPYVDPGRPERQRLLQEKKKWQHKQIFKPARLEKTLNSASYKYQCIKPDDKTKKYRNEDGKVITKSPNVCANLLSNLEYKRIKDFKYTEDPYDNLKIQRKKQLDEDLAQRGQPFKSGSPVKQYFSDNKRLFDDTSNLIKKATTEQSPQKQIKEKNQDAIIVKHETSFRPSSGYFTKYNGLFNKITYKQEGNQKKRPQTANSAIKQSESFKSMNKYISSRPCPSVSLNKMNLMRRMR